MALADLEGKAAAGDVGAQIALAERLDGEGRHEDAINWLARAAKAGNAEALTRIGKRLITGQNAPALPAQGAGLLVDAAGRGGGEAAAILAVLMAVGFHCPQSWPNALDGLQRSAELGWAPAQTQLRILAGETAGLHGARLAGPASGHRPRPLADPGAADPDAVRSSPHPDLRGLRLAGGLRLGDGQAHARLVRAEIYAAGPSRSLEDRARTNTTANFTLVETNLINLLIQAKIGAAAGVSLASMEAFNILHYDVGEQFVDHFDFLDPAVPAYAAEIARIGQRAGTFLLYLNGDYEGGETAFTKLGLSHKGTTGGGLFFSSVHADTGKPDVRSAHAGRTPTRGEKWVLSQFIRSRPGVGPGSSGV